MLAAVATVVCVAVFPPWAGIWLWMTPLPDSVAAQVDEAADYVDGVIVYVDGAGQGPALFASGWRDRVNQVPADPTALFKIASVSKLYVAATAAKVVHRGSLALSDTLADRLPDLADRVEGSERITMQMLLQHRSGIPDYAWAEGFSFWEPGLSNDDNLAFVLDLPAEFGPGLGYAYSNTNYLLLGRILDNVLVDELGYGHRQFMVEELLQPRGLTSTFATLGEVNIDDVASGYHRPYPDDLRPLEHASPGGSMVATAEDVGVFLRALGDGSLLSSEEQAIYSSVYEFEHTGWLPGYQSAVGYHKDIDAVIVLLISTTGDETELVTNVVYDRLRRILKEAGSQL